MRKWLAVIGLSLTSSAAMAYGPINTNPDGLCFDFEWFDEEGEFYAGGSTSFEFVTTADTGIDALCTQGWAANLCRENLSNSGFTTGDGGNGSVTFSVIQPGNAGSRRQTLDLEYQGTGAIYNGTVPTVGSFQYFGEMEIPSNPDFYGYWYESDCPEELTNTRRGPMLMNAAGEFFGENPDYVPPVDEPQLDPDGLPNEAPRGCSSIGNLPLGSALLLLPLALLRRRETCAI